MHDAAVVRGAEAARDLQRDVERRVDGSAPAPSRARSDSPSRHSVTRNGGAAVIADVVDRQHVGVIERAGGAGFVLRTARPRSPFEGAAAAA